MEGHTATAHRELALPTVAKRLKELEDKHDVFHAEFLRSCAEDSEYKELFIQLINEIRLTQQAQVRLLDSHLEKMVSAIESKMTMTRGIMLGAGAVLAVVWWLLENLGKIIYDLIISFSHH